MKKILFSVLLVLFGVSAAFAAVELKSAGTLVGKVETINVTGATTTVDGKDATLAVGNITTDQFIDGSIYLTGANGASGVFWISQPDAGCSRCTVDAAGTTFSCADQTCPSGM